MVVQSDKNGSKARYGQMYLYHTLAPNMLKIWYITTGYSWCTPSKNERISNIWIKTTIRPNTQLGKYYYSKTFWTDHTWVYNK